MVGRVVIPLVCWLLALPVAAGDGLWEWVTPWPQGHDLYAAAAGNGVTVAVGRNGTVITSTDDDHWTITRTGADCSLRDVVWGNGRFVAVGSYSGWEFNPVLGVILTSDDGVGWLESVLPEPAPSWFEDVTWTWTHFVAVSRSSGDLIFTSTDGVSWSSETTGTGVWPVSVVGDERNLYVTGRGLEIIRRTEPLADSEPPRRSGRRVAPAATKVRAERRIQR